MTIYTQAGGLFVVKTARNQKDFEMAMLRQIGPQI